MLSMDANEHGPGVAAAERTWPRGRTTFYSLREALVYLHCKWLRLCKLSSHRLSLNMSGNRMSCHRHAGVMLIRDAHSDYTRLGVYIRLGEGGDISRLAESRLRLMEIAGIWHKYLYMLFGMQVLGMIAGLIVSCMTRLPLPCRIRIQGWHIKGLCDLEEFSSDAGPSVPGVLLVACGKRVCGTVMLSFEVSAL